MNENASISLHNLLCLKGVSSIEVKPIKIILNYESNIKSSQRHTDQSRPQSPRPLDQRSGSAWALVESKTGTRKSWFQFYSARASETVVEMNKFKQPMRFGRFFGGLSV